MLLIKPATMYFTRLALAFHLWYNAKTMAFDNTFVGRVKAQNAGGRRIYQGYSYFDRAKNHVFYKVFFWPLIVRQNHANYDTTL